MPRGPAPTPTAVLKLRGSWRAKTRADEPQPATAKPPCPQWLAPAAKREFERVAQELVELGVLAKIDMAVLAAYCQNYSRWAEAEAGIADQGLIVRSPNGYPINNPFISIANEAQRQMRAFASELGLSPSARTRIRIDAAPSGENKSVLKRDRS